MRYEYTLKRTRQYLIAVDAANEHAGLVQAMQLIEVADNTGLAKKQLIVDDGQIELVSVVEHGEVETELAPPLATPEETQARVALLKRTADQIATVAAPDEELAALRDDIQKSLNSTTMAERFS